MLGLQDSGLVRDVLWYYLGIFQLWPAEYPTLAFENKWHNTQYIRCGAECWGCVGVLWTWSLNYRRHGGPQEAPFQVRLGKAVLNYRLPRSSKSTFGGRLYSGRVLGHSV